MYLIKQVKDWLSNRAELEMLQADIEKYGVAEVKTWRWWKLGWRYFKIEIFICLAGLLAVIYAFITT